MLQLRFNWSAPVHSTLLKFSQHIAGSFLIKFSCSDEKFNCSNFWPLRLKFVISACATLDCLLIYSFYKFCDIMSVQAYIVDSHWRIDSVDVGMKITIWIFLKYFLVYNSSLKTQFSNQAMNMKIRLNKFCKRTL